MQRCLGDCARVHGVRAPPSSSENILALPVAVALRLDLAAWLVTWMILKNELPSALGAGGRLSFRFCWCF